MKNAPSGSLGTDSNLYMLGGVLSTVSPTEEYKLKKRNQFYVDESIVTINSPELEDVNIQNLINNSDGLQLNLVGTIPINSVYGEYDMQTQSNGLANNACTLYLSKSTIFSLMSSPLPTTTPVIPSIKTERTPELVFM